MGNSFKHQLLCRLLLKTIKSEATIIIKKRENETNRMAIQSFNFVKTKRNPLMDDDVAHNNKTEEKNGGKIYIRK